MQGFNKIQLKILVFFIISLALISSSLAVTDIMGLQMTFDNSSISGDVNISIYDEASDGNLIYEEIFPENISLGEVDLMLGINQNLNLEYGKDYYLEIIANGTDLTFNGADRQQFQSNIGNITSTRISPANITADLIADDAITASKILNGVIDQIKLTFSPLVRSDNIAWTNQSNDFTADQTIGGGFSSGGITLQTNGDIWINGTLHIIENITNVEVVNININGTFMPSFDNLFDFGSTSYRWANGYFNKIFIDDWTNVSITESQISDLKSYLQDYTNIALTNQTNIFADDVSFTKKLDYHNLTSIPTCSAGTLLFFDGTDLSCVADVDTGWVDSDALMLLNTTNFINTTHILDRTIAADDLADSAINTTHILDRTITADDLADNSVNVTHTGDIFLLNTGDTASGDYNFDDNTLFIDSGNNYIGIRTNTPANALNVIGDANITGDLWVGGVNLTILANVSGGGLSGYITKFTGTETIGNSLIYESGNFIGIGTGVMSPTQTLSVFGDSNITGNLTIGDSLLADYIYPYLTTNIVLAGGNVGIGTSSPSNLLDVRGDGNFSGTVYINNATDLTDMVTSTEINASYALNISLANYVSTVNLSTTLPDYLSQTEWAAGLVDYVNATLLGVTMGGYVNNTNLSTTLAVYISDDGLATALADYINLTQWSNGLLDYVNNTNLSQTLANYQLAGSYLTSEEINESYALNTSLANYDLFNYNQTIVDSVDSNLTLTGTTLGINGDNILTWLNAIYQPIGAYLSSTELNASYARIDSTNTFTLNQTLSDELILSQNKNIYFGAGYQYYNGTCMIIKGSTVTMEIC